VSKQILHFKYGKAARRSWVSGLVCSLAKCEAVALVGTALLAALPVAIPVVLSSLGAVAQEGAAAREKASNVRANPPPRVAEALRFLAARGRTPKTELAARNWEGRGIAGQSGSVAVETGSAATAAWQPLGPIAVATPDFGLVTGRVTALAIDPSDTTGNHVYLGTTGGGVWVAQNAAAASPATVVFTPLTDTLAALSGVADASISIGALTVQPGGTGVVLAGTGDPNDVLDSYYGGGILRSTDSGTTWSLNSWTDDVATGLGAYNVRFLGEGFAGFAWSTVNPQLVVAAVSQAYEGVLVNAVQPGNSYEGLYYSLDSGATWHLATIADSSGNYVQGPLAAFALPDGNAATSVVWNPIRKLFMAAVRFHGYYQSTDGANWMRMSAQPGSGLSSSNCPTNTGLTGSIACPIFRGTLAVNPFTGDTFAWSVDLNNQDQGLWQDQCALSSGSCTSQVVTFSKQWSTSALETSSTEGAATIVNGDYTLALAAVPAGLGAGEDTLLLAGANDLWKCSLAMGCAWRNTTNSATCQSAQVGEFQHALAWNVSNPAEVLLGNDSGLWRSTDGIGESGQVCSPADASHFQNLNGSLGSLAEIVSLSGVTTTPYTMMSGLGVNGTAGVKSSAATSDWPQILGGYGGPVAVDPTNSANWYVNNQAGVSIYLCAQSTACTAAAFGSSPVVSDADVGGDGNTMPTPAPFLVDPLDPTQLLVATCRVWRGPANGSGWTANNAISPILDSVAATGACSGDALIRSIAALKLPSGGERIYVGMYGSANGGANLPGHVLTAIVNPASSTTPVWSDVTLGPVTNGSNSMNSFGMDISSIFIDSSDASGETVCLTLEGAENSSENIQVVYRTTDGGAHWSDLTSNLPETPASSIVVDPNNPNIVYVATDDGVFSTTGVSACSVASSTCWSAFGTALPAAPAVALSTSPAGASSPVLVAATYGRGIWQIPLASAGTGLTTASVSPTSLMFSSQPTGTASSAQTVTLANSGSTALTATSVSISGDFTETDNCVNTSIAAGASCNLNVTFTPTATGSRTGQMTINANIAGGQIMVALGGTGVTAGVVSLSPSTVNFGQVEVGTTSAPLQVQAANSGGTVVPVTSVAITAPFTLASNSCGATSLAADTSCQLQVAFAPTQAGLATGTLTFVDGTGTQTVALSGTGAAAPTDSLSTFSLAFPATVSGQLSATQTITLTNSGDLALTAISVSVTGAFQTSNNCGGQLGGHAACTISVVFAPTQVGSLAGTLTVSDALRTQTAALTGTGIAPPVLSASPSSLNFSTQQPGVASAPQTVTVSNTGGAPLSGLSIALSGPAAASYSISATTCGTSLATDSSCTVQVVFTPSANGAIAATLAVSSSTLGVAAVSVALNGAGQLSGGLGTSPAQVTFSTVGVGLASTAVPVTITNSSGYAVGTLALAINGPFILSQNTCSTSLAAGASCTAAVLFEPTASGTATGALTVTSGDMTTPVSVLLSGTGFDFTATVSGSSSVTVSAGQTADFVLTIDPINGVQGAFTFACGSLPAYAKCVFNPTTTTISAGATGSVTLEASTGTSGSARMERPAGWRLLPLACGLLLLPLALGRRRNHLLLIALLAVVAVSASSCTSSGGGSGGGGGGGGGGSGSSSTTPPGTYSIPVTITSTGISHVVTLTLIVD